MLIEKLITEYPDDLRVHFCRNTFWPHHWQKQIDRSIGTCQKLAPWLNSPIKTHFSDAAPNVQRLWCQELLSGSANSINLEKFFNKHTAVHTRSRVSNSVESHSWSSFQWQKLTSDSPWVRNKFLPFTVCQKFYLPKLKIYKRMKSH